MNIVTKGYGTGQMIITRGYIGSTIEPPVTPLSRTLVIPREIRTLDIVCDARVINIPSDNRTLEVMYT